MFPPLRKRLHLTPGMAVAVLALVLAMVGGAYAAGGGLSGKQKKEVTTIAKKYAGKPGANGTNGTNGSPGAPGEKGAQGAPGAPGANGASVALSAAGKCLEGGTKLTVGGESEEVCNGAEGEPGPEGSPWTDGGTLPPEKTETGVWNAGPIGGSEVELIRVPISFPIPLAAGAQQNVTAHFINKFSEGGTAECPAESAAELAQLPPAPGNLCVYKNSITGGSVQRRNEYGPFIAPNGEGEGVSEFGTTMVFYANTEEGKALDSNATGGGLWAVTAAEE